nr:MAG TPA: hypothetical protein [Caudoviricetes sp.]
MKYRYNKWRVERHSAGARRRCRLLTHIPFKRLHSLTNKGYKVNSMGLCYCRRFKLRLGSRKVCVARYIIVVEKEEKVQ